MEINMEVIVKNDYLVTKFCNLAITRDIAAECFSKVSDACKRFNRLKVLVESHYHTRKLSELDVYDFSKSLADVRFQNLKMAILIVGRPLDHITRFSETVAVNRGVNIAFFDNRITAMSWLGIE